MSTFEEMLEQLKEMVGSAQDSPKQARPKAYQKEEARAAMKEQRDLVDTLLLANEDASLILDIDNQYAIGYVAMRYVDRVFTALFFIRHDTGRWVPYVTGGVLDRCDYAALLQRSKELAAGLESGSVVDS